MKTFALFVVFLCMFTSCIKDHLKKEDGTNTEASSGVAQVNEDGYLTFQSLDALKRCLKEISENTESGQSIVERYLGGETTRSANQRTFISVAMQEAMLLTRSGNDDSHDVDDEEMTIEEFGIARAGELLYEDALTYVMDTTLRIVAGDKLYQVTEYGTFVAPLDKADMLSETILNFNNGLSSNMTQLSEDEFLLSNGITYINTFYEPDTSGVTHEFIDEDTATRSESSVAHYVNIVPVSTRANNDDEDVKVGEDWGAEFNYFSNKRRMKCKLYRVNYGIGRYAGYKCKYQKRKRFLGVKYWVKTNASKMEITINSMELSLQLTLPSNPSPGDTPLGKDAFAAFSGYVGNSAYTAIVRAVGIKPPFLKGWAKDAIGITLGNFTDKIPNKNMESVYKMADDQVKRMFTGFVNKRLEPLKRAITPQDQRVAFLGWGRTNIVRTFTTGTRTWTNTDKQNITLVNEGGFALSLNGGKWSLRPQFSISSTIKKCDITGSVTADGVTKSIQIIK